MIFDNYSLKARVAPTILTAIIPIVVFNHFYVSEEFAKLVGYFLSVKILSNFTISSVCLFFLTEVVRVLGKNIFQKIFFKEESYMPTTNFMMYGNGTYSDEFKNIFRNKIKEDFNINLPTADDENNDEALARKRIVETMAFVRKKLHGNTFLLQHNIEYGAVRNAIGGSILGILLSSINIYFFINIAPNALAAKVSVFFLGIYLLFIVTSKLLINFYGTNYAKILFREYLG